MTKTMIKNSSNSMNNQSFLKLPMLLVTVFLVVYFSAAQGVIFLTRGMSFKYIVHSISASFISVMLLPTLIFFIMAIFYCQKYRLHSLSKYGLRVLIIGTILALLYIGWSQLISLFYLFVISPYAGDFLLNNPFALTMLSVFIRIFGYVIFIFLLWFLFHIMTKNGIHDRKVFQLEGENGSRVYAAVYSILMILIMAIIITLSFPEMLSMLLTEFGYRGFFVVSMILIFIIFSVLFVCYILFYFATYNSFKRIDSTLKLSKLILTALMTHLFVLVIGLVVASGIFLFCHFLIAYIVLYHSIMILVVAILSINFILLFLISRRTVEIMYG